MILIANADNKKSADLIICAFFVVLIFVKPIKIEQ